MHVKDCSAIKQLIFLSFCEEVGGWGRGIGKNVIVVFVSGETESELSPICG